MLLDPDSFDLVQHIDTFLAAVAGHELEAQMKAELMQSVLEIATPVCDTPAEVDRELRKLREYVTSVASQNSLRVGSAGTHPFSLFEKQRITARDRYRALVDQMQYVARRELIFGLHIHVAVDDAEKAIQVVNGLLVELPLLLALSASSPFWRGEATGLASTRQTRVRGLPALGPAAEVSRLRRLRGGRRPAREDRLHRGLHAHLVGHPPAPAAGDGRGPDLRLGVARRARRRAGRVLPGAREDVLRAVRPRRGDPLVPPDPDEREQVARRALRARGAADGPRHRGAEPRARRAADPAPAEGADAAREGARLGERAGRDPRDPGSAETAPTASSASSTRTGISPRSSARSPTRQKPPRFRPSARATRSRRRKRSCCGRRWRRHADRPR